MDQVSIAVVFGILYTVIVFFMGRTKGEQAGRADGYAHGAVDGALNERENWLTRAQEAADAGTPWVGVDLPPVEEPAVDE